MASFVKRLRRGEAAAGAVRRPPLASLFASDLTPLIEARAGEVLVWQIKDDASQATVTDQFKANAETYHRRYAAADHFEALFRQALEAAAVVVPDQPLILDLGSGSGVNSIVPCARLFPGARQVATDLSAELLAMLAEYSRENGGVEEVLCVKMDAMSQHVAPGAFDLVTGASILHHLERPGRGIAAAARALKPGGRAIFLEPFSGWSIMRLAFERILAEAELRRAPLAPALEGALRRLTADVRDRSVLQRSPEQLAALDDKWLFSRAHIEKWASAAGFSRIEFAPHNDGPTLYREMAGVHLRLSTGCEDLEFPQWALGVLDSFDAALNLQAKRDLMLEASIILTKGA